MPSVQAVSEQKGDTLLCDSVGHINLENAAIVRAREAPSAPDGLESFAEYCDALQLVVKDAAARMCSLDGPRKGFQQSDIQKLIDTPPSPIAGDRFILTATPPEEYRRRGVIDVLKKDDCPDVYYLVDLGESRKARQNDLNEKRDVYLLRVRVAEGDPRHDAEIDAFRCGRGQGEALKGLIERRLFEARHPASGPLGQPEVSPEVDRTGLELDNRIIKSGWRAYCWSERLRKLGTFLGWVGAMAGAFAVVARVPEYVLETNLWAGLGARLGVMIPGILGLNLMINNMRDLSTTDRLCGIGDVVRGQSSEKKKMAALSKLRPSDFEFLARRAEDGAVTYTVASRYSSSTEVQMDDDEGIRILEEIGVAAVERRDALAAKGVYVPDADWYVNRLGSHVTREENAEREPELSAAISDIVETFRKLSAKPRKPRSGAPAKRTSVTDA